jgi:hypothetical protein
MGAAASGVMGAASGGIGVAASGGIGVAASGGIGVAASGLGGSVMVVGIRHFLSWQTYSSDNCAQSSFDSHVKKCVSPPMGSFSVLAQLQTTRASSSETMAESRALMARQAVDSVMVLPE